MNIKNILASLLIGGITVTAVGCGNKPVASTQGYTPVITQPVASKSKTITVMYGDVGTYTSGLGVRVTNVQAYSTIKADNMFAEPAVAGEGQALIVVDLQFVHDGTEPVSTHDGRWKLTDEAGRSFAPRSFDFGLRLWVDENRPNDVEPYTPINPGSSHNTETLVFEVPADAVGLRLTERDNFIFNLAK